MDREQREVAAQVLKAMAHPVRLGVIELLADGEMSVTELYEALDCSQSTMSTQLKTLQNQGLIQCRKEGTTKYCSLRTRDFLQLFECLRIHLRQVLKVD